MTHERVTTYIHQVLEFGDNVGGTGQSTCRSDQIVVVQGIYILQRLVLVEPIQLLGAEFKDFRGHLVLSIRLMKEASFQAWIMITTTSLVLDPLFIFLPTVFLVKRDSSRKCGIDV